MLNVRLAPGKSPLRKRGRNLAAVPADQCRGPEYAIGDDRIDAVSIPQSVTGILSARVAAQKLAGFMPVDLDQISRLHGGSQPDARTVHNHPRSGRANLGQQDCEVVRRDTWRQRARDGDPDGSVPRIATADSGADGTFERGPFVRVERSHRLVDASAGRGHLTFDDRQATARLTGEGNDARRHAFRLERARNPLTVRAAERRHDADVGLERRSDAATRAMFSAFPPATLVTRCGRVMSPRRSSSTS